MIFNQSAALQSTFLAARRGLSLSQKNVALSSVRSIADEFITEPKEEFDAVMRAEIGTTIDAVVKLAMSCLERATDESSTILKTVRLLASEALQNQAIARRCKTLQSDKARRLKLSVDEVRAFEVFRVVVEKPCINYSPPTRPQELAFAAGGAVGLKSFYMVQRIKDVRALLVVLMHLEGLVIMSINDCQFVAPFVLMQLKILLRLRGLRVSGLKAQLVDRLAETLGEVF
jgi:hypothetical protein